MDLLGYGEISARRELIGIGSVSDTDTPFTVALGAVAVACGHPVPPGPNSRTWGALGLESYTKRMCSLPAATAGVPKKLIVHFPLPVASLWPPVHPSSTPLALKASAPGYLECSPATVCSWMPAYA